LVQRIAKIGYESQINGLFTTHFGNQVFNEIDLKHFDANPNEYTILDVRNTNETKQGMIFENAIAIPLPELRERWSELPIGKPIAIHCAAGYRSAAAQSILANHLSLNIYDIGDSIGNYKK
jgi:rhodanese-related sulfurtransferase